MNQAVGTHLVIKIDREKQKAKSILTASGLVVAPQYEYMQYNLQYGEILSVGEQVTDPNLKVGRLAIIHHLVESEDQYLIETMPNGDQIRWVNSLCNSYNYKLFGVMDEWGQIIPLKEFVFCHPEPSEDKAPEEYEYMTFGTDTLRFSTEHREVAGAEAGLYVAHVPTKVLDRLYLRPVIASVSTLEHYLKPGQQILAQDFTRYPIQLLGQEYWIIAREFVLSTINPKS